MPCRYWQPAGEAGARVDGDAGKVRWVGLILGDVSSTVRFDVAKVTLCAEYGQGLKSAGVM